MRRFWLKNAIFYFLFICKRIFTPKKNIFEIKETFLNSRLKSLFLLQIKEAFFLLFVERKDKICH